MFKNLTKSLNNYKIQKKSTYKKTLFLTTLIGSAIGAGVAFFGSPTSGAQNRKLAVKKTKELANFTKDKLVVLEEQAKNLNSKFGSEMEKEIKQIAEMASDLTTSTRENLTVVADKLNQAISSFRKNLNKENADEIVNKIENLGKNASNKVGDIVEDIKPKK